MRQITAREVVARDKVSLKKARRIATAANAIVAALAPLGCCEAKRQLRYFTDKVQDPCDPLSRKG
jgi:hypothetical protein